MYQPETIDEQLKPKTVRLFRRNLAFEDSMNVDNAAGLALEVPPMRRHLSRLPEPKKLLRYGSTSVFALAISEVTLLLLYANNVVGATSAALLANLAGTLPSYLLSRYWIWSSADRRRPGRQAAFYWVISIISMLVSSFATGQISHHTPRERVMHLVILGSSYFIISLVLWVAKFVVYERTIFRQNAALEPVSAA